MASVRKQAHFLSLNSGPLEQQQSGKCTNFEEKKQIPLVLSDLLLSDASPCRGPPPRGARLSWGFGVRRRTEQRGGGAGGGSGGRRQNAGARALAATQSAPPHRRRFRVTAAGLAREGRPAAHRGGFLTPTPSRGGPGSPAGAARLPSRAPPGARPAPRPSVEPGLRPLWPSSRADLGRRAQLPPTPTRSAEARFPEENGPGVRGTGVWPGSSSLRSPAPDRHGAPTRRLAALALRPHSPPPSRSALPGQRLRAERGNCRT